MVEKNSTTGSSTQTVLVLGAGGLLGAEVVRVFLDAGFHVKSATHKELDITKGMDVAVWIEHLHPAYVVNCAALSNVDHCETHPDEAFNVNAQGVKNICLPLDENGGRLIHISTDYVFDGQKNEPYGESDAVHALSQYAKSKLKAEEYIQSILPDSLTVRVQWLYHEEGASFASQLVRGVTTQKNLGPYKLIQNRVGSPTHVQDVAQTLLQLVQKDAKGVIHVASQGACNWVEFGKAIFELNGIAVTSQNIQAVLEENLKRSAPRPPYSSLTSERLQREFSIEMPRWHDSLERAILNLKKE